MKNRLKRWKVRKKLKNPKIFNSILAICREWIIFDLHERE